MHTSKRSLLAAGVSTAATLAIAIPLMTPSEATTPALEVTELSTALDGAQEVPPADPNGVGQASVFRAAGTPRVLCYVLFVDNIATAQAAHIHRAAEGVNGPIVVELRAPSDGNSAACVRTRRAARIFENPQNFYINVHNRRFPDGAVRGQLG